MRVHGCFVIDSMDYGPGSVELLTGVQYQLSNCQMIMRDVHSDTFFTKFLFHQLTMIWIIGHLLTPACLQQKFISWLLGIGLLCMCPDGDLRPKRIWMPPRGPRWLYRELSEMEPCSKTVCTYTKFKKGYKWNLIQCKHYCRRLPFPAHSFLYNSERKKKRRSNFILVIICEACRFELINDWRFARWNILLFAFHKPKTWIIWFENPCNHSEYSLLLQTIFTKFHQLHFLFQPFLWIRHVIVQDLFCSHFPFKTFLSLFWSHIIISYLSSTVVMERQPKNVFISVTFNLVIWQLLSTERSTNVNQRSDSHSKTSCSRSLQT